jgi:hypothetical protein
MRMPSVGFGVLLMAGCGGDATVRDGGVDATGADAAEGELVAEAIAFADGEVPASFDVVPDVTGDGRDDVVIRYFSGQDGPEVVIARWSGGALERVASIEGGGAELAGPRMLVADVVDDAAPELLMAGPYDGVLHGFATPMAGASVVADAVLALEGPRNSFFATMHTRGGLLAGGGEALVFATPGEPEEACFSSEPPVLLARPLPTSGTVAAAAVARFAAGDPFGCPGVWMTGDRDWTGDGVDDLVVTSTSGGGRLFAGPIEDGRPFAGGVGLAVARGPYGGYGVAGGAVVDLDGDGAVELGLVDQLSARSRRRGSRAPRRRGPGRGRRSRTRWCARDRATSRSPGRRRSCRSHHHPHLAAGLSAKALLDAGEAPADRLDVVEPLDVRSPASRGARRGGPPTARWRRRRGDRGSRCGRDGAVVRGDRLAHLAATRRACARAAPRARRDRPPARGRRPCRCRGAGRRGAPA